MSAYSLSHLSDQALLAKLAVLVTTDRQTTASLLAHIAEVDARKLYLPAACSSMHVYCMRVLHLAEDAAFKRIRAARAAPAVSPESSAASRTAGCTPAAWCSWRRT